jgi:hypothetical protein
LQSKGRERQKNPNMGSVCVPACRSRSRSPRRHNSMQAMERLVEYFKAIIMTMGCSTHRNRQEKGCNGVFCAAPSSSPSCSLCHYFPTALVMEVVVLLLLSLLANW